LSAPELEDAEINDERNDDAPSTSASATDYIITDAKNLPESMFPVQLRFMDLSVLDMESELRVPAIMLIRDEWYSITGIIKDRLKGRGWSVIITGQPGIGR
jgi:hypothetical protein